MSDHERAGRERLAAARARVASQEAQEGRQDAVRRFCNLGRLMGLDKLVPEGRQHLLRTLVDEIVLRADVMEIHGVLPGRWTPPVSERNRPQRADAVVSHEPSRYTLVMRAE